MVLDKVENSTYICSIRRSLVVLASSSLWSSVYPLLDVLAGAIVVRHASGLAQPTLLELPQLSGLNCKITNVNSLFKL